MALMRSLKWTTGLALFAAHAASAASTPPEVVAVGRMAFVRGEEDARVEGRAPVKSVSNEQTFAADLENRDEIVAAIDMLAAKVGRRLRHKGLA